MAVINATGSPGSLPLGKIPPGSYKSAYTPKQHEKAGGETFDGPGDLSNIDHVYAKSVEISGAGMAFSPNSPTHIGVQFIDLEDRKRSARESMEEIRKRVKGIPGAKLTIAEAEEGPPTGAPINIEISGRRFSRVGRDCQKNPCDHRPGAVC